jgi:prevent-host-death family protein
MVMKTINVADLKTNLSRYLRRVRSGERFTVLDRKEPVAALVPLEANGQRSYRRLVEEGRVVPSKQKLSSLKFTHVKRTVRIQEALDDVRSDRI